MNTKKRKRVSMTGCLPADMIFACLAHHKRYHLKVEVITLRRNWWVTFLDYLKDKSPEMNIHNSTDVVEFRNVTIKKGSLFMSENMEFSLIKPKAEA